MEKKKVVKCTVDDNMVLGVEAISLVEYPAIQQNWVALNKIKLAEVVPERRMLYGPALIPEQHILRIHPETNEEYYITFDAETIQKCAHQYLIKNLQHSHTLEHKFSIVGCTVVESWLVESEQDKSTHLGFNLPVGTWVLGVKVQDDDVWQTVKDGVVKGFSIEGMFNEVPTALAASKYDAFLKELERVLQEYK